MLLQEADRHTDDTVTAKSSHIHLIHASLTEKLFHDEDKPTKSGEHLQVAFHHLTSRNAVLAVDADVDRKMAVGGDELDDGNFGGGYDLNFVCDTGLAHGICEGPQDVDFFASRHRL